MVTHRPATLGPVSHVAMLVGGKLVDFGERDEVLQRQTQAQAKAQGAAQAPAAAGPGAAAGAATGAATGGALVQSQPRRVRVQP